ncbi:hypothetical protein ACHQM5_023261 [Ranunculus cassubicifolius]
METCALQELPDILTEQILESLPIRDLVRTSVLSTAWRERWKTIPCLVFDERYTNVAGIVDKILAQHTGPIQSFKLRFLYLNKANVSGWINILKEKGIKNLSIEMVTGLPGFLNESVFACDKLEVLKLRLCLLHPPRSYNNFAHLKDLHLDEVNITEEEFRELASKCPALEKLTLINVDMESLQLSNNPKLKYLHIQGSFHEFDFENLQEVKFFLLHLFYMIENVDRFWQRSTCYLSTVFATLTGIEKLELWSDSTKFFSIGYVPMKLPFMLNSLKEMFLGMDFTDLEGIAVALALLRSSPNLETLRIGESLPIQNHSSINSYEFWEKQYREDTNLECLKFVVMGEIYPVVTNLSKFTGYIRKCAPALQRVDFIWMSEASAIVFES